MWSFRFKLAQDASRTGYDVLQVTQVPGTCTVSDKPTAFKVRSFTPLWTLMEADCSRMGLEASQVRFMVEWGIIEPNDTVEFLGIYNSDTTWVEEVLSHYAQSKLQFCPACLSYCKHLPVAQDRELPSSVLRDASEIGTVGGQF